MFVTGDNVTASNTLSVPVKKHARNASGTITDMIHARGSRKLYKWELSIPTSVISAYDVPDVDGNHVYGAEISDVFPFLNVVYRYIHKECCPDCVY